MTRAVDGAQRPADPPRLLVVDLDLRLLHGADRLRRQHALAVYHAVPHLETEEGEQIPRAGDDAAGGVAAAADVEGPRHLRRVLARELGMSRRRRVDDGLMGEVERPLQPKRVEDALLHRRLEARPGDHLDDAAGDAETAAVKAPELAGRGLLRPVAGSGDVPLQRIIAFSGIIKPVPLQAAGVGEQMAQRDRRRRPRIGKDQVRQVRPDPGVKVEQPRLKQPHDQGRGEDLAVGADLKEGVGTGRVVRLQTDDAEAVVLYLPIVQDGDRYAGDLLLRHGLADDLMRRFCYHRFACVRVLRQLSAPRSDLLDVSGSIAFVADSATAIEHTSPTRHERDIWRSSPGRSRSRAHGARM
jgi:hypothetical protein